MRGALQQEVMSKLCIYERCPAYRQINIFTVSTKEVELTAF
jgi:hypothetical protein